MRMIIVVLISTLCSFSIRADWQVKEETDAMTDQIEKSAYVTNEKGHSFTIYRISDGPSIWGNFSLSDRVFDQLDFEKPPMFRVDKNKPTNLENMKKVQENRILSIHAYEWEPKWVNFLIWHGLAEEGISNELIQIMEGDAVVFRYYLSTGGHKDTSFTLRGAGAAISQAIGISENIDHPAQLRKEEFTKLFKAEIDNCGYKSQNRSAFQSCSSYVDTCRKQANMDIDRFRSCMR